MSEASTRRWGGVLHFNWAAFDPAAGVKYAIGVVLVYALAHAFGGSWFVAGIGALLAWFTDVPGTRMQRVLGIVCFGALGLLLTLLSHWLGPGLWIQVPALFVIAFAGTMLMATGQRGFMVGWSSILWFLLLPLFSHPTTGLSPIVPDFLYGTGVVAALTLAPELVRRLRGAPEAGPVMTPESAGGPALPFVAGYSLTVATTLSCCLLIGGLVLESDPTLVANAAFMVIGPDSRQTWITGVDRAIGVILGITAGFLIFLAVQNEILVITIGVILSFLSLALMNVNAGLFIFLFAIYLSHGWMVQGLDRANEIANERILAELGGIFLAGVAVTVLQWWSDYRDERHRVRAEQSGL